MGSPEIQNPVALILPGYSFYVSMELAAGVSDIFGPRKVPWITVSGGYLSVGGDRLSQKPGSAPGEDALSARDGANWIYDFIPSIDLSGAIIYGGGIGFLSGQEGVGKIFESLGDIPLANVGSSIPGIPSVNADNYHGMFKLVDEVIGGNPDARVGFFKGPPDNSEAYERLQAYLDALDRNHRPRDPDIILQGDFTSDTARRVMNDYIDRGRTLPDGLICANDLTAFGVAEVLRERGIAVPEDMFLTGFDDFEYAAAMHPTLTTVHFPIRQMGREAARLILKQIDLSPPDKSASSSGEETRLGNRKAPYSVHVPAVTEFRESTGHGLTEQHVARARDMLLQDMRTKERSPFRSAFTKILLEEPRLQDNMADMMKILPSCGVRSLMIFLYNRNPGTENELRLDDGYYSDGQGGYSRLEPDSHIFFQGKQFCPPELFGKLQQGGGRLHICPLQHEDRPLGYILANTSEEAVDFAEIIASQLSGYFFRWNLIRQSQRDRDELSSMVTELQKMQLKLDNVERLKEMARLIAGVGHELNTPIGSSITLASFLSDRVGEVLESYGDSGNPLILEHFFHQVREAADSLNRNLNRTSTLVSTFKSLTVDPAENRIRSFAPYQVLDISIQRFSHIEACALDVHSNCPEELFLMSDPDAFETVLEQLFQNSIFHSYSGLAAGVVDIEVVLKGDQLEIRYSDYGEVSDQLDLDRLFEPFYTTARSSGRSGLGLHIVHNLIRYQLKGVITARRKKRGGLNFLISIPTELNPDASADD